MILKYKQLIIMCFTILSLQNTYSQNLFNSNELEDSLNVVYNKERAIGAFIHTRGFGFNYWSTSHLSVWLKQALDIQFHTLYHPKEVYTTNQSVRGGFFNRYIYGKMVDAYALKVGYGLQHILAKKVDRKSVQIRWGYYLGANLTFTKPYYINVVTKINNKTIETPVKYNPDVHTIDSISSGASYFLGFNELNFYPAGYIKTNLYFEFGKRLNVLRALELGATLDIYPNALPIMAHYPTENFIFTLSLGFVFGKKW